MPTPAFPWIQRALMQALECGPDAEAQLEEELALCADYMKALGQCLDALDSARAAAEEVIERLMLPPAEPA